MGYLLPTGATGLHPPLSLEACGLSIPGVVLRCHGRNVPRARAPRDANACEREKRFRKGSERCSTWKA
jgi:hypothetical protein